MSSFARSRIFLFLFLIFFRQISLGQADPFEKEDKHLEELYEKMFTFYQGNYDSLEYYSNLFTKKFTEFINKNPATLTYKFKTLTDSNACHIVTSPDGLFRIYSWDTWLGGTMHDFSNIYQFKSNSKIHSKTFAKEEDDFGTYFMDISILKANGKTYYIAISGGSESTKYGYETIRVYTISNDTLNNNVKLFKTQSGLNNSIGFEYDFFSVENSGEGPLRLIKYDPDKKIIYIPVVIDDGKVTGKFIRYQFTGQYFEKVPVQKRKSG